MQGVTASELCGFYDQLPKLEPLPELRNEFHIGDHLPTPIMSLWSPKTMQCYLNRLKQKNNGVIPPDMKPRLMRIRRKLRNAHWMDLHMRSAQVLEDANVQNRGYRVKIRTMRKEMEDLTSHIRELQDRRRCPECYNPVFNLKCDEVIPVQE